LLTDAFQKDPKAGMTLLKNYLQGEELAPHKSSDTSQLDTVLAKTNLIQGIRSLLGPNTPKGKLFQKSASRTPFEPLLDKIAQARDVVLDPENTPIPEEFFVRVLAGKTIARIKNEAASSCCAALKKPGNLEERLSRWERIDPSLLKSYAESNHIEFTSKFGTCSQFTPNTLNVAYEKKTKEQPVCKTGREGIYPFGIAQLQGERMTQEDYHQTGTVNIGRDEVPFFAICDGYRTAHSVKYGYTIAPKFVADNLKKTLEKAFENKSLATISDGHLENILASVSVQLHDSALRMPLNRSGTTLAMALIIPRENRQEVWAVNVGSSRVLIVTKEKTIQLTEDADPTAERFRRSIERSGNIVDNRGRVGFPDQEGELVVARAIGNYRLVLSIAKITRVALDPEKEITLVIHCDGLNEVFSSTDTGDIANNPNYTTPEEKAEAMVKASLVGGSGDNLSAIVVTIAPQNTAP
jgi:serine/threonine protein phosphatase PrpC